MSTQVAKYGTVGLLSGGLSSERDISLMTGAAVLKSMRNLGIDVIAIDVQKDFIDSLRNYQLDRVFVALHGPGGEDGTLQGALEYLGISTLVVVLWPQRWQWTNCDVSNYGRA